jgi:hypothetical protein
MTEKSYKVLLDGRLFGTTALEFGDPPMGVVFGQLYFVDRTVGYDFIKQYCLVHSIEVQMDSPTDKVISTGIIKMLRVFNSENVEITGLGTYIDGMDSDCFTITIIGIDSERYNREFPEHILKYERMFDK